MRSNDKYTAMKTAGGKNYDDFVASLKSADAAGQAGDLADAVMSEISAQSSAGGSSLRMALYSGAVAAALTLLLALPSAFRGGTLPTEETVPMASEESPWRREQGAPRQLHGKEVKTGCRSRERCIRFTMLPSFLPKDGRHWQSL